MYVCTVKKNGYEYLELRHNAWLRGKSRPKLIAQLLSAKLYRRAARLAGRAHDAPFSADVLKTAMLHHRRDFTEREQARLMRAWRRYHLRRRVD